MDFSQFDTRTRAETGVFVPLCNPYTREPINGTDPEQGASGFMVRGTAARSVQSRMAEMKRAAKEAAESGDSEAEQQAAMEKLHGDLIDSAERFIISGVNLEIGKEPVGTDPERIRKILDMTFPDMKVEKDAEGNALTATAKGKDGEEITIPRFMIANWPFAQQVIEAAEDGERFLGMPASA